MTVSVNLTLPVGVEEGSGSRSHVLFAPVAELGGDATSGDVSRLLTVDPTGGDMTDGEPNDAPPVDPTGGDMTDGEPNGALTVDAAGGDMTDGEPNDPPPADPTGGDMTDGEPNRTPSMRLQSAVSAGSAIERRPAPGAVLASRLLGAGESARLVSVPAQVLIVQKRGPRARAAAHYVLLGPISGVP